VARQFVTHLCVELYNGQDSEFGFVWRGDTAEDWGLGLAAGEEKARRGDTPRKVRELAGTRGRRFSNFTLGSFRRASDQHSAPSFQPEEADRLVLLVKERGAGGGQGVGWLSAGRRAGSPLVPLWT